MPNCSGETKLYLPAKPSPISVPSPTLVEREIPKSMILGLPTSPSRKMMLSGDRSRWTTPAPCATANPSATLMKSLRTSPGVSGAPLMRSASDMPFDELHGEIGAAKPWVEGERMVSNDGVVMQPPKNGRFLLEQSEDRILVGEFRKDRLDGDRLSGLDVVAAIDLAHSARGYALVDLIRVVELDAWIKACIVPHDPRFVVRGHVLSDLPMNGTACTVPSPPNIRRRRSTSLSFIAEKVLSCRPLAAPYSILPACWRCGLSRSLMGRQRHHLDQGARE